MAIIAPNDLPSIMKVNSGPMKKYVLSKLGYPNVTVEISEDQFETIWKVVGDFISGYFPREQRLAVFYTQPLQSTYPLPNDAYWVQSCHWNAVSSFINDIFGAESFLFCLSPEFKVLAKDGSLQPIGEWKKAWKAKTPYGPKNLTIVKRNNLRLLPKVRIEYGCGVVEATNNHVFKANNKWREFSEVNVGDTVHGVKDTYRVQNVGSFTSPDAISVRSASGAYYGCTSGEPILIH